MKLYKHNMEAFNKLIEGFKINNKLAYISATGSGKTYVSKACIDHVIRNKKGKILIVVPRLELAKQWKDQTKAFVESIDFITYHKLPFLNLDQILNMNTDYALIIFDEIHHFGAPIWGSCVKLILDNTKTCWVLGLSADANRYDLDLNMADEYFDDTIVGYDIEEAISKNIVNPMKYITVLYKLHGIVKDQLDNLKGGKLERSKDYVRQLIDKLNTMESSYNILDIVNNHLKEKRNSKILVFVSDINSIFEEMEAFKTIFKDSPIYCIHSSQSDSTNTIQLNNFVDNCYNGYSFLFSVNMLNEGIHLKNISAIIMLRRTQSPTLFLQQIGRCFTSGSNQETYVFDFASNYINIQSRLKHDNEFESNNKYGRRSLYLQIIMDSATEDIVEILNLLHEIKDNSKTKWTKEKLDILKKCREEGMTYEEIRKKYFPLLTLYALKGAVRKYNLTPQNAFWSEQELKIISDNRDKPISYIQENLLPHRSKGMISHQSLKMGIIRKEGEWQDWEYDILKDKFLKMTTEEIHQKYLPNRTVAAIDVMKRKINLKDPKFWSEKDTATLIDNIHLSVAELQERFFPSMSRDRIKQKKSILKRQRNL